MPETLSPHQQEEQEQALTSAERKNLLEQLRRETPPKIGAEAFKATAGASEVEREQRVANANSIGEIADIITNDAEVDELSDEAGGETFVASLHHDYANEARARGDTAGAERHDRIAEEAQTRADALDDEADELPQRR